MLKGTLAVEAGRLMAAAGDENERGDKDPDPVVVENTAKTVVIHKISSLSRAV